MKKVISILVLSMMSVSVLAGVSTTTFSGSSFSNSVTNGASNDVSAYIGGHQSVSIGQGAFSASSGGYVGSDVATANFRERSNSHSSFSGTVTENGLVGASTQTSDTTTNTRGRGTSTASGQRIGYDLEVSVVGSGFGNGSVGGEATLYSSSYSENTRSRYGSNVTSNTYSTDAYAID